MLQFIIGVLVGGIFGFVLCVIFTSAGTNDGNETQGSKRIGDEGIADE